MAEDEAISGSLDRLHIHEDIAAGGKKGADAGSILGDQGEAPEPTLPTADEPSSSSQIASSSTSSPSTSTSPPPILVCDAWYGFPTQKRPRKERINAVSRQLSNFLEWQSSSERDSNYYSQRQQRNLCRVSLLGTEGDVRAVQDRMKEHAGQSSHSLQSTAEKEKNEVIYQSNVTIHDFLEEQQITKCDDDINDKNNNMEEEEEVVYLSPDATHTLSSTSPPPRVVIIGMLIDRRVTTDRSRVRAEETLNLKAVKLPLDELNVKELTSHEPLNVDTVMELMQRWWWNCDRLVMKKKRQQEVVDNEVVVPSSDDVMYRRCFVEAAAWAMKTQRERHPNRTVHNATSKKV